MTEKEKMLAGELYDGADPVLTEERKIAKTTCQKYNLTKPEDAMKRVELLHNMLKIKPDCYIEPPFYCDYGYNTDIGRKFYANHGCIILDVCKVKIGRNVMLGPNVQIITSSHPMDSKLRTQGLEYGEPISIGDNVWIGAGAIILPGVTIGNNSVIGAGSIVTENIPENKVAVGNPCKVMRNIED
jgi:maltose O-acetyltransferase